MSTMSYSKLTSASVQGVDGCAIAVEVDLASGLPQINVVGLPDPSVRESVERVRAALRNSGFQFPMQRITVNLAPADIRKEGTAYDLAIAAAILIASAQLQERHFKDTLVIGELALSGELCRVPGVLPMAEAARRIGMKRILLPAGNAAEAALISGMEVYAASSLKQLAECCREAEGWDSLLWRGDERPKSSSAESVNASATDSVWAENRLDYSDVLGQHAAKRALAIAAAGRHNILLSGPPGTGKTMLIRRLPGILPPMSDEESLEVTKIYSVAGKLARLDTLITERPFRSPHHTISAGGLVGGGSIPRPGEVTLAHRGVLFLDELPEFPRAALESLRQPLEDREVTLARARAVYRFPASFQLAASMNPCPCGFLGATAGGAQGQPECSCSQTAIDRYRSRISGPMLDRIDLLVEVQRPESIDSAQSGMSTADMRALVQRAIQAQQKRRPGFDVLWNGELSGVALRRAASLQPEASNLLQQAFDRLGISLRARDRILKLSRTIADMEGCEVIEASHVAEAIQYRRLPGWS
ncbi:YifB family Mg chelatase-like AAA ATPase [Paenibacillus pasadenensis]|uniref:YifB family Mg chelatase-like AAA ATPase n=1 Tax=Paenibacillus pasadenensis TaxID=217090 RepID=UPI00203B5D5D|nr:YifB family Mg chelatase-like AAA ATPase [Paenibacillus pasadenensis]MCM3746025.1 YifB family Mg chelatase-like AAA ATPase [Paenibacillus pasadenensis]